MTRIWPRAGCRQHDLELTTGDFEKIEKHLSQPLRLEDQKELQEICDQYLLNFDLQTAAPNYGDVKSLLERLEMATDRLQKLLAEVLQEKSASKSALQLLETQLSRFQDDNDGVYGVDRPILQLEFLQHSTIRALSGLEERFGGKPGANTDEALDLLLWKLDDFFTSRGGTAKVYNDPMTDEPDTPFMRFVWEIYSQFQKGARPATRKAVGSRALRVLKKRRSELQKKI